MVIFILKIVYIFYKCIEDWFQIVKRTIIYFRMFTYRNLISVPTWFSVCSPVFVQQVCPLHSVFILPNLLQTFATTWNTN